MDNLFKRPFLNDKKVYFPYSRQSLQQRPIFPTLVFDGGAFFFANDHFGTTDGDELLKRIMDGSLFDYWKREGEFGWDSIYWDFRPIGYTNEWEGHIWINRFYLLLPLAQAYLKTKEEKYARVWLTILKDFMQKQPYTTYGDRPADILWRDMQVAWRSISLLFSIFMLGDCALFQEADWNFIYHTVKVHANHMIGEGEKYALLTEPDNHRLQIGTALTMFACLFPEFFDVPRVLDIAKKLIVVNMQTSIFSDGCNNEDSMSYSHFIARLYLEAELLLKYNGHPEIAGLHQSVQNQYAFLYAFSSPAGKSLQIGDSYAFDAAADIAFVNSFYSLDFVRQKTTRLFEGSRMAYLANGDFSVYVDAMDMDEWHQHFGRPHFLLFYKEQPLVVDSGSVNYDRGWIRRQLNSEKSHNVIYAEEIPLTKRPSNESLRVLEFLDGEVKILEIENRVTGEGKGYVWTRRFALFDDRLEMTDRVQATEKMHFVSRLFLPDCRMGYAPARLPQNPQEEQLRFGSLMERVLTQTPYQTEFTPCVDGENQMNYAQCLVRRFDTDSFEEKTVIRCDKIRDAQKYNLQLTPEWQAYFDTKA